MSAQPEPDPKQQRWQTLRRHPAAVAIILRNSIPVFGVFVLGWPADLVLFDYWFDGLSALGAILAVLVPGLLRQQLQEQPVALSSRGFLLVAVTAWLIAFAALAAPYWLVLLPLGELFFSDSLASRLADWRVLLALAVVAALNLQIASCRNYAALTGNAFKQALRWDVYVLLLRAQAMFLLALPLVPLAMVVALAVALTWMELFPARALRAFVGDPERLWAMKPARVRRRVFERH